MVRQVKEFSTEQVSMMREINRHPVLCKLIASQYNINDPLDWGGVVGEIAAYCNVVMDGDYYPSELENLYKILYFKLQAKRHPQISLSHLGITH